MGRTHSATEDAVLNQRNFKVHYETRVDFATIGERVGDPTYDPFVSGSIESSIDQPVMSATFNFHLGKGSKSLSPFLSTGLKNTAGTGPAIYPGQIITFRTACVVPEGHFLGLTDPASAWRGVFAGRIDSVDLDPDKDLLTVKCRDLFSRVQDTWIDTLSLTADPSGGSSYKYGFPIDAARVDVAMQQIMTKSGVGEAIFVRGIPDLAIGTYWQEQMTVMEALRRIGTTTTGWDLRGVWDVAGSDTFGLTYYNPDRAKTLSDVITVNNGQFGGPSYYSLKLSTSLVNVRNRCDVIPANDLRVPQRVEDVASVAQFGTRFAGLSEDRSSHIDTDAEALTLAGIMVADLSSPPIDLTMEMPYYWLWELNDLFRVDSDGSLGQPAFSYDGDHIFAVSNIVHTFAEGGEASTSVSGSLAARAAIGEWIRGRVRRNQVRLGEPAGPGLEGDTWFVVDDLTVPTVL